ncbi:hypothetical protein TW95_gp1651 [Pandoravirus inopinatum]|uniref:Uncharacterized protein n=1 Tax=Pandoravirus inopinatum TaxID=1605721 RepID=A0A0B5J8V1_9VIRU|nr:hypothetical protein TW95_gp1651 [Pandoravirus inopinatum]AJF98385.1 hypothetical protein [Pandoravirus inopinatum]
MPVALLLFVVVLSRLSSLSRLLLSFLSLSTRMRVSLLAPALSVSRASSLPSASRRRRRRCDGLSPRDFVSRVARRRSRRRRRRRSSSSTSDTRCVAAVESSPLPLV